MLYAIVGGFIGNLSYRKLYEMLGVSLLDAMEHDSKNYFTAYQILGELEEYIETIQR